MLVDTFGTLDEDRWWDAEKYAEGEQVELSKEFVRTHYIETGHQAELESARNESKKIHLFLLYLTKSFSKQQTFTLQCMKANFKQVLITSVILASNLLGFFPLTAISQQRV